ncbi:hypothetical protein [Paenibacillus ferrarius]|uniref:hypothetical protein n=1 Tax=Paenibacillus ferrarius TaxID=1469647 RepID=UPI003D2CF094
MEFELAHEAFLKKHVEARSGERKGRLERGHRDAEKLFCREAWWPLRGQFDNLHPEFEVLDWRGRSFFCDFAYLTAGVQLMIEIKGYGPHVRDMDRQSYCYELNRETFLTAMGYRVISFAYDDVVHRPELCVSLLRMVLSYFQGEGTPHHLQDAVEREALRLAYRLARPLRPIDVEQHLHVGHRTAVKTLQSLCSKSLLSPVAGPGGKHVVRYELRQLARKGMWL